MAIFYLILFLILLYILVRFLRPKIIATRESKVQGILKVYKSWKGQLSLNINGNTHSVYGNWKKLQNTYWGQIARTISKGADEKISVLFLGLGGGTCPTLVHELLPRAKLLAVEFDPVVVELAKEFFGFSTEFCKVIVGDIKNLALDDESFDFIVHDAMSSRGGRFFYPRSEKKYLLDLLKFLKHDGKLIINVPINAIDENASQNLNNFFVERGNRVNYQKVKDGVYINELLIINK